jgi:glutamine cyclotransferase
MEKVFGEGSAEYATLTDLIKWKLINVDQKAILYDVQYRKANYHFHYAGKVYKLSTEFCDCPKDKCVSADHECALKDFF